MPGLTELVCALGLENRLIGRSHECDYPTSITNQPILTSPKYSVDRDQKSADIHQEITYLLQKALSVYEVHAEKLVNLNPDIILTQDHCEVCAVSMEDLSQSVKERLNETTQILSVSPTDLGSILESFNFIATQLDVSKRGTELVQSIQNRFDEIRNKVKDSPKPTVAAIEWIDPLMIGGNWIPEMIEIAGGQGLLSTAGEHSSWIRWEEIVQCDPDILLILPCGYPIEQTMKEMSALEIQPGWNALHAVRKNNVYILDGNHYFNRPGPGIKDSVEILARIFHPSQTKDDINQFGWIRYSSLK